MNCIVVAEHDQCFGKQSTQHCIQDVRIIPVIQCHWQGRLLHSFVLKISCWIPVPGHWRIMPNHSLTNYLNIADFSKFFFAGFKSPVGKEKHLYYLAIRKITRVLNFSVAKKWRSRISRSVFLEVYQLVYKSFLFALSFGSEAFLMTKGTFFLVISSSLSFRVQLTMITTGIVES